ncbi:winged helix DNA-binding domain-containing protein [Neoconidiobolus thromboides FSU 785]|nr:winged helix DNA-binding domain-containing protein [Neoconidiobolus thromboides FSU 785]
MNKNCITTKKNSNNGLKPSLRSNQNTFVHKLGTLINDPNIQDSIYWNTDGRSFTVKNIDKFSKTVLPLHFKHNNFSSFIRQLNMYGFHKVNRSPRGHRSDPAFQTWEFSHKLFVRDKLEQINDIKRTTNDADSSMKNSPSPDIHSQVALMYSQQKEMVNTIHSMSNEILQLRRELSEANRVQQVQQQVIRKITNHLQNINSSSNNNNNNNINNSNNNQLGKLIKLDNLYVY